MIKIQIIGHIGKDAIVRDASGKQVISFSVAHTEKWKDAQGEQKQKTTWVEVSKWVDAGKSTAVVPYLLKGTLVFVEGTPEASAYADKEGKPAASLKLTAINMQLLGGATATGTAAPAATNAAPPPPPQPVWNGTAWVIPTATAAPVVAAPPVDDDLPF